MIARFSKTAEFVRNLSTYLLIYKKAVEREL